MWGVGSRGDGMVDEGIGGGMMDGRVRMMNGKCGAVG